MNRPSGEQGKCQLCDVGYGYLGAGVVFNLLNYDEIHIEKLNTAEGYIGREGTFPGLEGGDVFKGQGQEIQGEYLRNGPVELQTGD